MALGIGGSDGRFCNGSCGIEYAQCSILVSEAVDSLSSLNPAQRDAVLHTDGPLLILAGAGSGKTRVITSRIAHLIASGHARPDEVLAVTFTNKAAEEMRTRVEQLLGEDCRQIWISTFHSLSARLLRREAPAIGLSRDFVIYDSSDQIAVVKQAMKSLDIDDKMIQPRAALARISQAKNRMESPEAMRATGWSLRDQQISRIYEAYLRALTRRRRARLRRPAAQDRRAVRDRRARARTSTRASSSTCWSTSIRTPTGRSTC